MLTLQLQTVLKEAEAVVNCRPYVYVDDDLNSNIPLTTGHFLSLNPMTISPAVTSEKDDDFHSVTILVKCVEKWIQTFRPVLEAVAR